MIPGVTLGARQAGPAGTGLTASATAATPAAATSAPFGEFVAWLALGMASPEAASPLAGRRVPAGRRADEPNVSIGAAEATRTQTEPGVTAPVEVALPTPTVVWFAPASEPPAAAPSAGDEAASPPAADPCHEQSNAVGSSPGAGVAATAASSPAAMPDDPRPAPAAATVSAAPVIVPVPAAVPEPSLAPAPSDTPDARLAGSRQVQDPDAGRHRGPSPQATWSAGRPSPIADRPEGAAHTPVVGRPITESTTSAGETRVAEGAPRPSLDQLAATGAVGGAVGASASVPSASASVPSSGAAPVPARGRMSGGHLERTTGEVVAESTPAVVAATPGRQGDQDMAAATASLAQPVTESSSPQPLAETVAAAGLRLRRGLVAVPGAPAPSPHRSSFVALDGEAVVAPSPRGADEAPAAIRARDVLVGTDGVAVPGRRDLDLVMPATGVPAALEPRDNGRASLGLAAPAAAGEGASLDEVLPTQIIRTIRLQWQAGQGEARVQLRPDYLGELTVAVKVDHGAVTATLHAEAPEVRRWLESHSGSLRDALAEQGLRLDRLIVADEHGRPDAPDAQRREGQPGEDGQAPPRRRRGRPTAAGSTFDVPTFDSPERTPA